MSTLTDTTRRDSPTHTDGVHPAARVAIVGGGIAGLSAAWYLEREAERAGLNLRYTVLEASDRWGGKIISEQVAGFGDAPFVIEGGPDSFFTQKPWALQLARELGMDDRLLGTNDHLRKTYVLSKGRPVPPAGWRAADCADPIHALRALAADLAPRQAPHGAGAVHPAEARRPG
ncbi:MAG: FAD-dependent oxidoreductase [Anaerolineae bacterium]|nr:FAD-dependent oxidoreductase [Anaerolineae bacterium]